MQKVLGKYGIIYKHYLKEYQQKLYQYLTGDGTLLDYCCEKELELNQLYEVLDKKLRESNPRPKTDSFMEIAHYETNIANTVHEFIIDNIAI